MKHIICLLTGFCLMLALTGVNAATRDMVELTYPRTQSAEDPRFSDLILLLITAMKKTESQFGPFQIKAANMVMTESRYLQELSQGKNITVAWSSTSEKKEARFRPIRIPLHKGLLGYRIAFIKQQNQARIDQIKNLEDLKQLKIGQGIGWGDVDIYRYNKIPVHSANYESLFKLVSAGRIDLFPRGINEIFAEYKIRQSVPNLKIEENLLLFYPWPYYFFVNKNNPLLGIRIETGLRMMIRDGSFDRIFHQYNDDAIERANLSHRRIIRLANPLLPEATPLNDKSLWYVPKKPN